MHFDLSIPAQLTGALTPDLILMGGAMVLLLIAVWGKETEAHARLVGLLSIGLCVIVGATVVWMATYRHGATATPGIIAVDNFRWATDLIVLLATIIAIVMAIDYSRTEQLIIPEAYVLVLLASSGMMLLAGARDLVMVFLGIELMSIAVYVLAGLDRRNARAAEAALKYFLLGAFSTAFLVYGIALVYGGAGSTNIGVIGSRVSGATFESNPMLLVGIALLVVGFGFKVAAVPFHMWTPDVYEGAPTPVTAYMAVAVKAAAFAAFLRVWEEAFAGAAPAWHGALWWLAVLTMVVGNVVALAQKNVKRMLAYSSIAHAGYILVAVVVNNALGTSAFIFYLVSYTLATMGAFAVVMAVGEPGERRQELRDFAGLWRVRPWLAAAMAVFMLALLGFPIAGGMGFFAKWYVIQAALGASSPQTHLAVVLVLASVVSAGYYLAVVMVMFMRPRAEDAPAPRRVGLGTGLVIGLATVALLVFGIFPTGFVRLASHGTPVIPPRVRPAVTTAARPAPPPGVGGATIR
ncbi:MAG TPA: NADH-quinone oxidoreductase subunit N [Gemmatimonadaceae bacterium]|nr:NADH-quinone oxidoreductase subunit N [Gemmatimonadaceae bacterium]